MVTHTVGEILHGKAKAIINGHASETEAVAKAAKWLLGIICFIIGFSSFTFAETEVPNSILAGYNKYCSSLLCTSCHSAMIEQHSQSYHFRSASDPLFKGQYFKELLPQARKDPALYLEAEACVACHSPIDSIVLNVPIFSEDQLNHNRSGVGCICCHTIAGYSGNTPGNGNYISNPSGERVFGPFVGKSDWHHVYSELHTKSEFCAICHNATNHYGLEIKSTFTEWKNSMYAQKNIQCQDCHMSASGFLREGKPNYEHGHAVEMVSVLRPRLPSRQKLYSHRFPGAHFKSEVTGSSLTLHIETEKTAVSPGDEMEIYIYIDNSSTGHKMPSGSSDLRQLWLQVEAVAGDERISIPAIPVGETAYDVTGEGPFDEEILGEDIPRGTRIYRAIFVDKTGRQTLSSYNAVSIIFDNRLNAAELRKETYYFKVPTNFKGTLTLRATLNYRPYPSSFARKFGVVKHNTYEVASAIKEVLSH